MENYTKCDIMNDPAEHPKIEFATIKDQMAEYGICDVERSSSKVEQVNKELAEEVGQKNASLKSAHEAKIQAQADVGEAQRQELADAAQKELQGEIDQQELYSMSQ